MIERLELDLLKQRKRDLEVRLAALRQYIQGLEKRLLSPAEAIAPSALQPLPAQASPKLGAPVMSPVQIQPPPIPIVPQTVRVEVESPMESLASSVAPVHAPPIISPEPANREFPQPVSLGEPVAVSESRSASPQAVLTAPSAVFSEPPPRESFEMRLGKYWFVRVGVIMVLTALGFAAKLAYERHLLKLGPAGKIGLLYSIGAAMLGTGTCLQRRREKDAVKNFGQVLIAGGLAAVYFTTYAAHYFTPLQVIASPTLAGFLLFGWACFIVWLAERKKSEVLGFFAVALAYYTSIISPIARFTLYSNLILTVAAVFFLVRNRWAGVSFLSLAATYLSYAYWRFYHDGQLLWRWNLDPRDFWTGNLFLLGYWIIFTAAVFLSKHEKLSGWNRAAFLSLNNGAVFAFVTLTLPLVYPGSFWKFSLGFGVMLIGLCLLAQNRLAEEKIAQNSYLAQGVVLVTLGFITYFSRPTLALVLAQECVVLLVLNSYRKSTALSAASYAIGAVAVVLQIWETQKFDWRGLYSGAAVGTFMFFNAIWRNECVSHPKQIALKPFWFSSLALLMWFVTTWQNAFPQNLGLTLAVEASLITAVFYLLNLRASSWTLPCYLPFEAGAHAFSAVAVAMQVLATDKFDPKALYLGAIVGALMVFNATCRNKRETDARGVALMPAYFSLLALSMWLEVTLQNTERTHLPPVLALEALLITASYYLLKLRELSFMAQGYLVLAQLLVLWNWVQRAPAAAWWNPASVIAVTIALSHWWQRQKTLPCERPILQLMESLYALAAVGVLFFWLQPIFGVPGSHTTWLWLTSVVSVGIAVYGALTRAWFLCVAGQIFLAVSVWEFFRQISVRLPASPIALVPIATLILSGVCVAVWWQRKAQADKPVPQIAQVISLAYRVLALLMSLVWVHHYVSVEYRFIVLALLGGAVFLVHRWKPEVERLAFSS